MSLLEYMHLTQVFFHSRVQMLALSDDQTSISAVIVVIVVTKTAAPLLSLVD